MARVDRERGRWGWQALVALGLSTALVPFGCNAQHPAKYSHHDPDTTRYRLRLRENPVDPSGAFHCYSACQPLLTLGEYFNCLSACPGFEVTPEEYCAPGEVPPIAACFTVRKIPAKTEPPPGMVVLAVIGSFLLVVAAESLCVSTRSQCGSGYIPPPH